MNRFEVSQPIREKSPEERAMEFFKRIHKRVPGGVVFTDPITGEVVTEKKPPEYLERDEDLHNGYKFLREMGTLCNIEIIFARHDGQAESLGDANFNFEGRVKEADIFLIEGVGWSKENAQGLNKLSVTGEANAQLNEYVTNNVKNNRETQAIRGSGATIAFYDVSEKQEDTSGVRKSIIEQTRFLDKIQNAALAPGADARSKDKAINIHVSAVEALREWFIIGSIGAQIVENSSQNPDFISKLAKRNLKVLVNIGSNHTNILNKLRSLGVEAVAHYPVNNREDRKVADKLFPKWIANGAISDGDLESAAQDI